MKAKITWIGIIVGLLGLSVVTQGVLLIASINDPSFALEPDYEKKAANWDELQRGKEDSRRLGWTVNLSTSPSDQAGQVDVVLELYDRYGKPLRELAVDVEAFHNARASKILRYRLQHAGDGIYRSRLPIRRSGIWEFRLAVGHEGGLFTKTVRKSVLSVPRAAGGPS